MKLSRKQRKKETNCVILTTELQLTDYLQYLLRILIKLFGIISVVIQPSPARTTSKDLGKKRKGGLHESEPSTSKPRLRRSCTSAVNWEAWIFCQNTKIKETLCSVTTFKMSSKILDLSSYDQTINVRLSGVSDLIASERKYLHNCLKIFERNAAKVKETCEHEKIDLAMQCLTTELRDSAKHAHVLQLMEVSLE